MAEGTTATFQCDKGWEPNGAATTSLSCMNHGGHGRWSGAPLRCKKVQCRGASTPPALMYLLRGVDLSDTPHTPSAFKFGAKRIYTCNLAKSVPTRSNGACVVTCHADGSTSGCTPAVCAAACPDLQHTIRRSSNNLAFPHNGASRTTGTSIAFKCNYGYEFAPGSKTSTTCTLDAASNTAAWSATVPTCVKVKCPAPSAAPATMKQTTVVKAVYSFGDRATYTCDPATSYKKRGTTGSCTLQCGGNKLMTPSACDGAKFCEPLCAIPNNLTPDLVIKNAGTGANWRTSKTRHIGTTVTFSCKTSSSVLIAGNHEDIEAPLSANCIAGDGVPEWSTVLPECARDEMGNTQAQQDLDAEVARSQGQANTEESNADQQAASCVSGSNDIAEETAKANTVGDDVNRPPSRPTFIETESGQRLTLDGVMTELHKAPNWHDPTHGGASETTPEETMSEDDDDDAETTDGAARGSAKTSVLDERRWREINTIDDQLARLEKRMAQMLPRALHTEDRLMAFERATGLSEGGHEDHGLYQGYLKENTHQPLPPSKEDVGNNDDKGDKDDENEGTAAWVRRFGDERDEGRQAASSSGNDAEEDATPEAAAFLELLSNAENGHHVGKAQVGSIPGIDFRTGRLTGGRFTAPSARCHGPRWCCKRLWPFRAGRLDVGGCDLRVGRIDLPRLTLPSMRIDFEKIKNGVLSPAYVT